MASQDPVLRFKQIAIGLGGSMDGTEETWLGLTELGEVYVYASMRDPSKNLPRDSSSVDVARASIVGWRKVSMKRLPPLTEGM